MKLYKFQSIAEKLEAYSCPEALTGCILWQKACNSHGYGQIWLGNKQYNAHRVAYELAKGPIPEGLVLDHICRCRACINPDHLEAVTSKENILRGESTPARNAAKTICNRGHALEGANVGYRGRNRYCKKCSILTQQLYRATWTEERRERARQYSREFAAKRKAAGAQ